MHRCVPCGARAPELLGRQVQLSPKVSCSRSCSRGKSTTAVFRDVPNAPRSRPDTAHPSGSGKQRPGIWARPTSLI